MPLHAKVTRNLGLSLGAALAFIALAQPSHALEDRKLLALDVMAGESDASLKSFGSLKTFTQRLRRAGRICRVSSYARGANFACGDVKAPDLLIDFEFAPTRAPEFLKVGELRINGINGGFVPPAKIVSSLDDLLKPTSARR